MRPAQAPAVGRAVRMRGPAAHAAQIPADCRRLAPARARCQAGVALSGAQRPSAGTGDRPGDQGVTVDGLTPAQLAAKLGLALGMALFLGLAFEGLYKQEPRIIPGGIRTFPMLALLGALLYLLAPHTLLLYAVGLGALALWLYAHLRTEGEPPAGRPTLIVPATNLLAYVLGPIALTEPAWLLVSAAVVAVLLLEAREALHRAVRQLAREEVYTLGKFLILAGIILPLLPNTPVLPITPITPFEVWLALVAVSSLSYLSYLLQRYLPHRGTLVPSILGGAYSSTATTVALARQQKAAATARPELTVGIVLATAVMYLRVDLVVALFNPAVAWILLPRVIVLSGVAGAIAFVQWRGRGPEALPPAGTLTAMNPLQLPAAVTFAVLFIVVALAASWVRSRFGNAGIYALGGIAGVSDINPFVLSLAQGSVAAMPAAGIAAAILIAAASNNIMNGLYALIFGGVRLCRRAALGLFATAAVGLVLAVLTVPR